MSSDQTPIAATNSTTTINATTTSTPTTSRNLSLQSNTPLPSKPCPHNDQKKHARGMCSSCYSSWRSVQKKLTQLKDNISKTQQPQPPSQQQQQEQEETNPNTASSTQTQTQTQTQTTPTTATTTHPANITNTTNNTTTPSNATNNVANNATVPHIPPHNPQNYAGFGTQTFYPYSYSSPTQIAGYDYLPQTATRKRLHSEMNAMSVDELMQVGLKISSVSELNKFVGLPSRSVSEVAKLSIQVMEILKKIVNLNSDTLQLPDLDPTNILSQAAFTLGTNIIEGCNVHINEHTFLQNYSENVHKSEIIGDNSATKETNGVSENSVPTHQPIDEVVKLNPETPQNFGSMLITDLLNWSGFNNKALALKSQGKVDLTLTIANKQLSFFPTAAVVRRTGGVCVLVCETKGVQNYMYPSYQLLAQGCSVVLAAEQSNVMLSIAEKTPVFLILLQGDGISFYVSDFGRIAVVTLSSEGTLPMGDIQRCLVRFNHSTLSNSYQELLQLSNPEQRTLAFQILAAIQKRCMQGVEEPTDVMVDSRLQELPFPLHGINPEAI